MSAHYSTSRCRAQWIRITNLIVNIVSLPQKKIITEYCLLLVHNELYSDGHGSCRAEAVCSLPRMSYACAYTNASLCMHNSIIKCPPRNVFLYCLKNVTCLHYNCWKKITLWILTHIHWNSILNICNIYAEITEIRILWTMILAGLYN